MSPKTYPGGGVWLSDLDVRDLTGHESRSDRPAVERLARLGYQPAGPSAFAIWCPVGFRCDAASIPRILWGVYPAWARSNRAAVLHDYAYCVQFCSRERADDLFREALRACGVSPLRAWVMWRAVRIGGGAYWSARAPEAVQEAREHARRNGGLEVSP